MAREKNIDEKIILFCVRRHGSAKHESGTRFYVSIHIMEKLSDFEPVNERICKSRVKFKYYN